MKKNLFLIALSLFILTACGSSGLNKDLFGAWEHQASYLGNELEHQSSGTLKISANGYSSSTPLCTTSGSATSQEETLIVTMKESDCPSPLLLPFIINYTYQLSEDGNTLELITQDTREVYTKKK